MAAAAEMGLRRFGVRGGRLVSARRGAALLAATIVAALGGLPVAQAQDASACQGARAAACSPAIAGPWRHAGGSRTHRIEVTDQDSLEALRVALEARTRALYGRNACIPASIRHAGAWREDGSTADVQRERMVTLHEVGFLHGDECTVVGGATTFHTIRERSFHCEPGQPGPLLGSQGERLCGPATPGR